MATETPVEAGLQERPLSPAERAEHASRLLLAYKDELRRAPEIPGALHEAYFNAATTAHRDLRDGKVTFRRGRFVYEATYTTSSQNTELVLTKYPPIEDRTTPEAQEEVGVKLMQDHDGSIAHADVRYNHLFSSQSPENPMVLQTNTALSVELADKFLGEFRAESSVRPR